MPNKTEKTGGNQNWRTVGIFFLLLTLWLSCAQYDNETGKNLVGDDLHAVLKDTVIYLDSCATMNVGDKNNYTSRSLYIGRQNSLIADIFLRFFKFSPLADSSVLKKLIADTTLDFDTTVIVQSIAWHYAALTLYNNRFVDTLHQNDYTPWNADIFRVQNNIDHYSLTYHDELTETQILEDNLIGSLQDTGKIEIHLPYDSLFIDSLYRNTMDTLSLRIRPDTDAGFLKRFFAHHASNSSTVVPTLDISATYIFSNDYTLDTTISLYPGFNTYLTDDIGLTPRTSLKPERLFLGRGFVRRMLLWGDFNSVVDTFNTINRVELWLSNYPDEEVSNIEPAKALLVYRVKNNWFDSPDEATLDVRSSAYDTLNQSEIPQRIDITNLTRFWQADPDSNFGIMVMAEGEIGAMSRRVFHGNSADTPDELKPRLRIVYSKYNLP